MENFDSRGYDGDENHFNNGRYAGDRSIHARFYTVPELDKEASAEAGRPICKEVEFVEIIAAGNQNNIVRRSATDEDRARFSRQYEKFRAGNAEQLVGTPLTEVSWLSRTQVAELAYLNIRTLEHLANMSDTNCSKFAGLYDLKRKAVLAMEQAEGMAPVTKLQEENEKLSKQVEALTLQLKELLESQKSAKKG